MACFLRIYRRIAKTTGNRRELAAETSQTGKAVTNCIFFRKSGLARDPGEAGDGGRGNRREKGRVFFHFLYIVRSVMFLGPGRGENVGKIEKIMGKLQ